MADELDLERGDPDRATKIAAGEGESRGPRRPFRQGGKAKSASKPASSSSGGSSRTNRSQGQRLEAELAARIIKTFDRIVEQLDSRGDTELSTAIAEDKEAMAMGLISLTRAVVWLRYPLVLLLNFVEPVMAFGRVGKILWNRWAWKRAQKMAEQTVTPEGEPVVWSPQPAA